MLIYGAAGYSGSLIAREALDRGLRPVLAGRDAAKVGRLAQSLGLPHRAAKLGSPALREILKGVRVLVNAAGPFAETTDPVIDACIASGVHYLDVSGEVRSVEAASRRHAEARAARIMVMPAAGFDVVASDCLAVHVVRKVRGPRRLFLGITGLRSASRGSARTTIDEIGRPVLVRRGGQLVAIPPASLERPFDYGQGKRNSIAVSWADVVSAFFSTGVPDIEVYFEATAPVRAALEASRFLGHWFDSPLAKRWMGTSAGFLPDGPGEEERRRSRAVIVAEVEGAGGRSAVARLTTPEVYSFTATAAVGVARRVLAGDFEVGFQTPARVYGPDFVLGLPNVVREELS